LTNENNTAITAMTQPIAMYSILTDVRSVLPSVLSRSRKREPIAGPNHRHPSIESLGKIDPLIAGALVAETKPQRGVPRFQALKDRSLK
jgi:hypothetical protein